MSGYSKPGWFGIIEHYDENGVLIGTSVPEGDGSYRNYDANHKMTGRSYPNYSGGFTDIDMHMKVTSSSELVGPFSYAEEDENGVSAGYTTATESGSRRENAANKPVARPFFFKWFGRK